MKQISEEQYNRLTRINSQAIQLLTTALMARSNGRDSLKIETIFDIMDPKLREGER
ncbi:MAG: hypothetical protein IKG59_01905 [Firmicutes bacterium]|nr:hypothetical protein [Bacillota bacterium]